MQATLRAVLLVLAAVPLVLAVAPAAAQPPARSAKEIAPMLPAKPAAFGRPVSDRPAWEALAKLPAYRGVVGRAERLLKEPLPDSPDEL